MQEFDYQSDRHCAKTEMISTKKERLFDYQSDRHYAKTEDFGFGDMDMFDYQSDRHCAKTLHPQGDCNASLITSQIDTAPKQNHGG